MDPRVALLQQTILARRNADGGWPYAAGKTSRLEPTVWAAVALGSRRPSDSILSAATSSWLARLPQTGGWIVEDARWPVNVTFNAMLAFAASRVTGLLPADALGRLLSALITSKGIAAPQSAALQQDSSLQGWPWIDGTFSWVEPTCWGLLALKRARSSGHTDARIAARIDEAERLLIDRCCRIGGWNFGNARVMHQDLHPYVPTTALGLLAMQDRRSDPAIVRSQTFLEQHWSDEPSTGALALSALCLGRYGSTTESNRISAQLVARAGAMEGAGMPAIAIALCALTTQGSAGDHVFAI